MTGDLVVGLVYMSGMLATLAVIGGLVLRLRDLAADREFPAQKRPETLADCPLVTIIVPARNEERNIGPCLESLLALDYPRFEIFVVDDHSTDRTAEIVWQIQGRDQAQRDIRLLSFSDDPREAEVEWLCRKSQALWHGAQQAHGEWILFVDADTRQKPDTLWRAMALARRHALQALSMSGVNVNPRFWGGVLEAMINPAIFLAIPWRRVNDPRDPAAWMNGNFILYERAAYFAIDGHRAIAGYIQDDLALALHSKAKGVRFLFLPRSSAFECRDFVGLEEAFRGWKRRLAVGGARLRLSRRSYAFEAVALFMVAVWPVPAAAAGFLGPLAGRGVLGLSFGTWALAQLGLVVGLQGVLRAVMGVPVWPAVAAPLGAAIGIAVVVAGWRARFVKKVILLRGRAINVDDETI